jgi:hypothetical protein
MEGGEFTLTISKGCPVKTWAIPPTDPAVMSFAARTSPSLSFAVISILDRFLFPSFPKFSVANLLPQQPSTPVKVGEAHCSVAKCHDPTFRKSHSSMETQLDSPTKNMHTTRLYKSNSYRYSLVPKSRNQHQSLSEIDILRRHPLRIHRSPRPSQLQYSPLPNRRNRRQRRRSPRAVAPSTTYPIFRGRPGDNPM